MIRVAHHLPPAVCRAASDLVQRASHKQSALHDQWNRAWRACFAAETADYEARGHDSDELKTLLLLVSLEHQTKRFADVGAEREARIRAFHEECEVAAAKRRAEIDALKAEVATLDEQAAEAVKTLRTLREAQDSHYGLAPWDTVALEVQRAWGEGPPAPPASLSPLLKGSEVAALVQARLGISRSSYYEWYRRLLRSYDVTPSQVEWLADGGARVHRGATQRFRRDEVEAMLHILSAEAR